jgi:tRNA (adenine37-N6)-methyltransferase
MTALTLQPIAYVRSCYPERFGIPRQPGLVTAATGAIVLPNTAENQLAVRGIEAFSHLWVIFGFHDCDYGDRFKPLVSPPRLGGKQQVGVYASRSPNRPNPIGLSAVKLDRVEISAIELCLHISGIDLLDGTPVFDIKPYVPYSDAIPNAEAGWATPIEDAIVVDWEPAAIAVLENLWAMGVIADWIAIRDLIAQTIGQDPRPAHERNQDGRDGQQWNLRVGGFNVWWAVVGGVARITQVATITQEN